MAQSPKEQEVKTEVKEVTVFIEGAQVTRKKSVNIPAGETVLKFINLSPFIDAKSVQVKAEGDVTVLSVNHQQNYLDKLDKSKELDELEKQLAVLDKEMKLQSTYMAILQEELSFLMTNKNISGKDQGLSVTNFKETSEYYGKRLTALKLKEIELSAKMMELSEKKSDINSQINTISGKREFPNGEILVKVDAKKNASVDFELSYVVGNAGWFPSYDIRAKNINEPVEIIYKANVKQDTKIEWKNVKLKFSSADPNVSGIAPELITYYLGYYTAPPVYDRSLSSVSGIVRHEDGGPLPGVTVVVNGSTVGTTTNIDGKYTLSLPNNASELVFSYIGYQTETLPIGSSNINLTMSPDMVALDEVVVTGYGTRSRKAKGRNTAAGAAAPTMKSVRGQSSVPLAQVENQTTVDFEIKMPYSVKSDNKSYSVDMEVYSLSATFQYYCVPKIDKDAFLIANIVDWEKYNLLEGEANLFFEGTYVGKSILDVRNATDTLQISLGRDKNVVVSREKVKDFTTKQFIGNKKQDTRTWRTVVKNNKSQAIDMVVLDQVPISTLEEIEVKIENLSNAKHNLETGEIKWDFTIQPSEKKEFELRYLVKYPKNRSLIVD
ncbi:mucoidy inhibitor MuiA family protein [Flammeovirgaceae bacterium SG7u.132]|nr:mucoidy inhibitor MuiA family protein [Flammeovirgaceae bacterium SG7u.132]